MTSISASFPAVTGVAGTISGLAGSPHAAPTPIKVDPTPPPKVDHPDGGHRPQIPAEAPPVPTPADNPGPAAHTFRALALIYPTTDVDYVDAAKRPQHLSSKMSLLELGEVAHRLQSFSDRVTEWSHGYAKVQVDYVVVEHPIDKISHIHDATSYWLSGEDVAADVKRLDPKGAFDNVIAVWKDNDDVTGAIIPNYAYGLSWGPNGNENGSGYSVVTTPNEQRAWHDDDLLVHEWLHEVEGFAKDAHAPVISLHDTGSHGYSKDAKGSAQTWYSDYMRGRVWDDKQRQWVGVTPETWEAIDDYIDVDDRSRGVPTDDKLPH